MDCLRGGERAWPNASRSSSVTENGICRLFFSLPYRKRPTWRFYERQIDAPTLCPLSRGGLRLHAAALGSPAHHAPLRDVTPRELQRGSVYFIRRKMLLPLLFRPGSQGQLSLGASTESDAQRLPLISTLNACNFLTFLTFRCMRIQPSDSYTSLYPQAVGSSSCKRLLLHACHLAKYLSHTCLCLSLSNAASVAPKLPWWRLHCIFKII